MLSNPKGPNNIDKHCIGCRYYYGSYDVMCNYILETGQRRPCPPGKGCTVRKPTRKRRYRKLKEGEIE